MQRAIFFTFAVYAAGHPGSTAEFGDLMHEGGEPLPNLEGLWEENHGSKYVLRRIQPKLEVAVPPNSTYAIECDGGAICGQCRQQASYDYQSRKRTSLHVSCHASRLLRGLGRVPRGSGMLTKGASQIFWNELTWEFKGPAPREGGAVSKIHTVHMIFMNHYDVGYTDFINPVDDTYMHKSFPKAAKAATEMRKGNTSDRFVYTSHPWLIERFLQCPCPSTIPPPPPGLGNLEGVWTGDSSKERLYISRVGDMQYAARCLTSDWTTAPPFPRCQWKTANCTEGHDGKVVCAFDTGAKHMAESQHGGSILFFNSSTSWHKFTGKLSGLWYGPDDSLDYYVMTHNVKSGQVTVWWDTGITGYGLWYSASGTLEGHNLTIALVPAWPSGPLNGTVDSDWDLIDLTASDAQVWNRHSHQCYPQEPGCQDKACLARSLGNNYTLPLTCPTDEEKATFNAAAKRHDIVWHAGAFNTQPENMSPELFDAGVAIARRLDDMYYGSGGRVTRTLSIRDAIYSTRSVVPRLQKNNITGLTIGSNGANFPPQVPKLHRWVDRATGADVIVAYHPYGYGGYGAGDCAESPNGVALCTAFRSDNEGPPSSLQEVVQGLNDVRGLYPGANVTASTFDDFFADVMPVKDQLPVVDLEVGDTWVYGNPSDPLKMAMNRAVQRVWIDCLRSGDASCSISDLVIQNMTWWLLKTPEHTWGTPGIAGWGGGDDYDAKSFRSKLSQPQFMRAAAAWAEQSMYNEIAIRVLEEAGHPLAARARAEADIIENVREPDMEKEGYTKAADVTASVVLKSDAQSVRLAFGSDGSITGLESGGVTWASETNSLAGFVYETLAEAEWKPFSYAYCLDHQEQGGFAKIGSENFTESKLWRPSLSEVWVRSADSVVAKLTFSGRPATVHGSPQVVYVNVTLASLHENGGYPTSSWALDIALVTLGKQPTMVGEAQLLTFKPAPPLRAPVVSPAQWREAPDGFFCPEFGCLAPSVEHGCKSTCAEAKSQCCWASLEEAKEQCGKWEDCALFTDDPGNGAQKGGYYYARGFGSHFDPGTDSSRHWVKERSWSSAWRLDKLGGAVDPEGVADGGTQYTHGVWGGATVETAAGHVMKLKSVDASNMNPMTASFPAGNPLPASHNKTEALAGKGLSRLRPGSIVGMAVNLHNNLWNTNYPLYYPFFDKRYCSDPLKCKNANLLFRFQLSATHASPALTYI